MSFQWYGSPVTLIITISRIMLILIYMLKSIDNLCLYLFMIIWLLCEPLWKISWAMILAKQYTHIYKYQSIFSKTYLVDSYCKSIGNFKCLNLFSVSSAVFACIGCQNIRGRSRIFIYGGGGGGGWKRLCACMHITSAEPKSLSAGVHQGPEAGPGSSRVVVMLFCAIWALFLSILIKNWI